MTLEELLKANGVSDEAVSAILAGMKENKIFTASEENLDIRYGKLKTDHDALVAQHGEATTLIEQLKKGTKGNEALQGKVTAYETQVADLQKELQDTKIKSAVKVALLAEKCDDIDYITYVIERKLKEDGKVLELDENENIKGWEDLLAGVKTQQPAHFAKAGDDKIIDENRLPDSEGDRKAEPETLDAALRDHYESNSN